MTKPASSVEACLMELFRHLGIEQAHIAAGQMVPSDWLGLAAEHAERLASLALLSPLPRPQLVPLESRLLIASGGQGPRADSADRLLAELPGVALLKLPSYPCLPWSDVARERGAELGAAMLDFFDRIEQSSATTALSLGEREGEFAGISYRMRGAGPPVVLMPLDLAPSQWEPLIPQLSERYCAISLGGPLLGTVSLLEGRGRSATAPSSVPCWTPSISGPARRSWKSAADRAWWCGRSPAAPPVRTRSSPWTSTRICSARPGSWRRPKDL